MKVKKILVCFILLLTIPFFAACSSATAKTTFSMEMEMDTNYDDTDPFVNEKLFYVSKDASKLSLSVSFQMKGESGTLEIADNETDEVFWTNTWHENVNKTNFTIELNNLTPEKEYVIRFTGTKIQSAKIKITSDDSLIKEREKPLKSSKN